MTKLKRLGKYEILEEIGRGGFSTVYKAHDTTLDRIVALKVLASHLLSDPMFVKRFRAEFETVSNLRYPNIVSVYEYGEAQGQPYIAMEYVAGRTLKQTIEERNAPLPLDEAYRIVRQVSSALTHALRQGVVHRDLKPSNILIDAEGRAKLTDFGIAKIAGRAFQTTTGRIFGSPEYMSPEQARNEELDHRSDVYSLGIVLYEMLTGKTPFTGDTPVSIMVSHSEREPPPPSQLNPSLPKPVEMVILKALDKSRENRFQSAAEFSHYLHHAIEGKFLIPEPPSPDEQKPTFLKRGYVRVLTGVGLLLGLVIVTVLIWGPGSLWQSASSTKALPSMTATATATVSPAHTDTLPPSATPTKTGTPTITPLPLPTTTPSGLILYDDFSSYNWLRGEYESEYTKRYVKDGEYYMIVGTEDTGFYDVAATANYSDFELEVDARLLNAPTQYDYGVIFWAQDGGNYYAFVVQSDVSGRFRQKVNGEWQPISTQTGYLPTSLQQSVGESRHIKLVCQGSQCEAFVNGYRVTRGSMQGLRDGNVGIIVGAFKEPVEVAFDNFKLWEVGHAP
ncbi:MAG: protein kinase [Anaerolineae bacterium]